MKYRYWKVVFYLLIIESWDHLLHNPLEREQRQITECLTSSILFLNKCLH